VTTAVDCLRVAAGCEAGAAGVDAAAGGSPLPCVLWAWSTPMSDVGDQLDRLPGDRSYGQEIVIVAQYYESFAFGGSGNEQVDCTG
jgi:hypothetical protein